MFEKLYQAIAAECRAVLPEAKKIYRDNIPQNFETPCVLVLTTNSQTSRGLANKQRFKHSFDVQYFPSEELQNLRKACETAKQTMLRAFDTIEAPGASFYVRNKTASITDDVLHMQFDVTYTEREETSTPKMEAIETEIKEKNQ